MLMAEDLVASGGPSAPVWAFLTAILGLVITNWFSNRKEREERREARAEAKRAADEARDEAKNAAGMAEQAVSNTRNISNGFVARIDGKLDTTLSIVQDIETRLTEHLAWHLREEQVKRNGGTEDERLRQAVGNCDRNPGAGSDSP